jgi:hypothetical protein
MGAACVKALGIVEAIAGLSGEAPPAQQRRMRLWALFFLAVALGAKLVDSLLKRQEAKEQAVRFERLAHPLGTMLAALWHGEPRRHLRAKGRPQ